MSRPRRILLVDDEPFVLESLEDSLRNEPYMVQSVTSAALALEIIGQAHVDVVVTDERMPGMAGSQFLSVLKSRDPSIMRIMLTGQASLEAAVRAINEGEVFRILLKPCAPAEFRRVIRSALEVKMLQEETRRLLIEARRRRRVLAEFAREHPVTRALHRDAEGAITIGEDEAVADPSGLLADIVKELDERDAA